MLLLIALVFAAVFALIVMLLLAGSQSATSKQTRATLAAVLKRSHTRSEKIFDVRKDDALSAVPWIDRLLGRISASMEVRRLLEQADIAWTPGRLVLSSAACCILSAYAVDFLTDSALLALIVSLLLGAAPLLYVLRKRAQRFYTFQQRLPDTIDLLVSSLRAGHSIVGALGNAASEAPEPIRREFRLCYEEQNYGVDLRTATDNLIARVPLQDLRIIITALLIHKDSGGNLAEVLEKTASVIRDRFRLRGQIRTFTAQGRITGAILALMPVALGIGLYFVNPSYMKVLVDRPLGHTMIGIAVGLNAVGCLIIRKIVRIRV